MSREEGGGGAQPQYKSRSLQWIIWVYRRHSFCSGQSPGLGLVGYNPDEVSRQVDVVKYTRIPVLPKIRGDKDDERSNVFAQGSQDTAM